MVAGVVNCGVVNLVMVVTSFVSFFCYCFKSFIVKCMLFYCGSGIGGVVVMFGMIVWY